MNTLFDTTDSLWRVVHYRTIEGCQSGNKGDKWTDKLIGALRERGERYTRH